AFLDDHELDALLDLAVARFVDPLPVLPDGIAVHQVEARLVVRHGWVCGIVVRQVSPHAVAWRWWSGTAPGPALSEADASCTPPRRAPTRSSGVAVLPARRVASCACQTIPSAGSTSWEARRPSPNGQLLLFQPA